MEIGYESTIKTWINTAVPDVNAFRSRLAVGGFTLSKSIRNTASVRASPNEGVMNAPTGFVILSAPFLILDQPNPNPGFLLDLFFVISMGGPNVIQYVPIGCVLCIDIDTHCLGVWKWCLPYTPPVIASSLKKYTVINDYMLGLGVHYFQTNISI